MSEKLLTLEEVAQYLNLSKEAVKELVDKDVFPAYKIGGSFLRFKREQIENYRRRIDSSVIRQKVSPVSRNVKNDITVRYTFWEKFEDFLYYNDFYILSLIVLTLVILAVFKF